jgi:thioredoxin 1
VSVQITTDATFAEDVLTADRPVLVEFTADWCGPCKLIAPVLAQIAADEASRLRVVSLDVDENPQTTRRYGVLGMPTLALFVDGRPVVQFTGARPRAAIMRELEPYLGAAVSV